MQGHLNVQLNSAVYYYISKCVSCRMRLPYSISIRDVFQILRNWRRYSAICYSAYDFLCTLHISTLHFWHKILVFIYYMMLYYKTFNNIYSKMQDNNPHCLSGSSLSCIIVNFGRKGPNKIRLSVSETIVRSPTASVHANDAKKPRYVGKDGNTLSHYMRYENKLVGSSTQVKVFWLVPTCRLVQRHQSVNDEDSGNRSLYHNTRYYITQYTVLHYTIHGVTLHNTRCYITQTHFPNYWKSIKERKWFTNL